MPPAISDDEQSDAGVDLAVTVPIHRGRKGSHKKEDVDDDEKDDVKNGSGASPEEDDDDDGDEDEEMDEDEYIVEKILSHIVESDGSIKYEVKWEGYENKADRTWESTDNLRENASAILDDYLDRVGGEDKILSESKAALKNKKRGRPSAGVPASGAGKRRRNGSHPDSATPPVTTSTKAWKPPTGSWEDEVESIDACHDEHSGKLIVYLTWGNGQKTQHDTKVIYQRCPQKMLQFYERHVKIVKSASDAALADS